MWPCRSRWTISNAKAGIPSQSPGNRAESPLDEQNEATRGPSETQIIGRFAPYRCFLSVCYGMPGMADLCGKMQEAGPDSNAWASVWSRNAIMMCAVDYMFRHPDYDFKLMGYWLMPGGSCLLTGTAFVLGRTEGECPQYGGLPEVDARRQPFSSTLGPLPGRWGSPGRGQGRAPSLINPQKVGRPRAASASRGQ